MLTLTYMLASLHIIICLLGLVSCIYLLCTRKVNTQEAHNAIPLCFFGLSWAIFLGAAINSFTNPNELHIFGSLLFLMGVLIWVRKKFRRAFI